MKELEFLSLRQGGMSVDAYKAEFNALSQYALDMVSDEEERVQWFQRGLKFSIRSKLDPLSVESRATWPGIVREGDNR